MKGGVLAPGKAILCGEYAVLHGAPAVSVAVDRVVRAWVDPEGGTAPSPFVDAAYDRVAAALAEDGRALPDRARIGVDSTALYQGEEKLGLGSSAAVTAAVVGALFHSAGLPLTDRARIFQLADEAHRAAQGTRGSGLDVATAVYGGAIRFVRQDGRAQVTPVALPELQLTFVFTGRSASTSRLLDQVKALAERDSARHDAIIGRLSAEAGRFADAAAANHGAALLSAARAYHDALAELGAAAGAEIVTPEHQRLAELARAVGGASKPSGAGGGDLGVAFTLGSGSTLALHQALRRAGLSPLSMAAPSEGLRLET